MLSADVSELVADADEGEFRDVRRAAGSVRFAEEIARCQRFARPGAHFEKVVRNRAAFGRHRGIDDRENVVELHLLNVFRGVDAKAGDAEPREHDQVPGDLLSDRREAGVEIGERQQFTVLNVGGVPVVVDDAPRMEVGRGEQARIVVLRVTRAVAPDARTGGIGHVVDDRIHINANPHRLAPLHHVRELGTRSRSAARDAVAHRLVALTPVEVWRDAVLLRRRDLHGRKTRRSEILLALGRDVAPFPLEQVDEHVARRHVTAGAIRLRERWPIRGRLASDWRTFR